MLNINFQNVHETILKYRNSKYNLNCSETIITAFNELYDLDMEPRHFSAFGGGMSIGHTCGAIVSAVGVLSKLFVEKNAYENNKAIKKVIQKFFDLWDKRMKGINCRELKPKFITKKNGCTDLILIVGEVLYNTIEQVKKDFFCTF